MLTFAARGDYTFKLVSRPSQLVLDADTRLPRVWDYLGEGEVCRSTLCQTQTAMISEFLHIMGRHLQDEEPKTAFLTSDADKRTTASCHVVQQITINLLKPVSKSGKLHERWSSFFMQG